MLSHLLRVVDYDHNAPKRNEDYRKDYQSAKEDLPGPPLFQYIKTNSIDDNSSSTDVTSTNAEYLRVSFYCSSSNVRIKE